MQLSMNQLFCLLSQYFQDTVSNGIEPCTQCYRYFHHITNTRTAATSTIGPSHSLLPGIAAAINEDTLFAVEDNISSLLDNFDKSISILDIEPLMDCSNMVSFSFYNYLTRARCQWSWYVSSWLDACASQLDI